MKYTFTQTDFDVFNIDGLENRMAALIQHTRPKLEALGEHFSRYISEMTGDETFAHVAKHARRTTNPPDDTWVAFSTNPRGYKMMPHFQIGLYNNHAFCMYGIIYESKDKQRLAENWLKNIEKFDKLPQNYEISLDHMKPEKTPLSALKEDDLKKGLIRLRDVKKGEFLVGKVYKPGDKELSSDSVFIEDLEQVMENLVQFYHQN